MATSHQMAAHPRFHGASFDGKQGVNPTLVGGHSQGGPGAVNQEQLGVM